MQEADGGFAEGPLEAGVADFGAPGVGPFLRALVLAFDEDPDLTRGGVD